MSLRAWIGSSLLLVSVAATAGGLAAWKRAAILAEGAAVRSQPEPVETVDAATATMRQHVRTTTSIGTVIALRSITLRNELPGTVREVALKTGAVVDAGTVLVALDVAVEQADLRAAEAEASLAQTLLGRTRRASESRGASAADVDRARAQRDVALAKVARIQAVIERKTIRAPFRARIGLANLHPGQYLHAGTELTTLQGVDDAVHVDFAVVQDVAAGLRAGAEVSVVGAPGTPAIVAGVVAIDARVDPATRNAMVRARIDGAGGVLAPGASVRVHVPLGTPQTVVTIPVNALRKGPAGDHVFRLRRDDAGSVRAHQLRVTSGAVLGDDVVIESGLAAGDEIAAAGSFKLYEGARVAVKGDAQTPLAGAELAR